MNTVGTTQGGRRPDDWQSKIEHAVNRAADAIFEGAESFAKELDDDLPAFRGPADATDLPLALLISNSNISS